MERLGRSAAALAFPVPPPPAALSRAVAEVLEASRLSDAAVRITVTRDLSGGGTARAGCRVEAEPLEARLWQGVRSGCPAAILSRRPIEPGPLACHKTTSRLAYDLAREEARARGADEALLVSPRGHVLEGSTSNLFAVVGGEILTPPLAAGILPGIARALVLAACRELGLPAREEPLHRDRLIRAEEVFLTNAVQQVVPVAVLEGQPLLDRTVGRKLLEAYRAAAEVGV